ncbi:hypothetical protein KGM_203544 [Danaus plexippus plexippus]|uniref:Uncharacterized protein n=1 Tax=Danaus plexippus plexippus TaxID=278856 RepID=A0A212ELJ0_DANPL|nr:hypothetical protein KGM_203544 [Danaus plexippus plexippus]
MARIRRQQYLLLRVLDCASVAVVEIFNRATQLVRRDATAISSMIMRGLATSRRSPGVYLRSVNGGQASGSRTDNRTDTNIFTHGNRLRRQLAVKRRPRHWLNNRQVSKATPTKLEREFGPWHPVSG